MWSAQLYTGPLECWGKKRVRLDDFYCDTFDGPWVAICDELRPLFGLPKLGTLLWIRKEGGKIRTLRQHKSPVIPLLIDEQLRDQIRRYLLLRECLELRSNKACFDFVWSEGQVVVRGWYETAVRLRDHRPPNPIPINLLEQWFGETTVGTLANTMIHNIHSDLDAGLHRLRMRVEKIIEQVDPGLLFMAVLIFEHLYDRCIEHWVMDIL